LHDADSGLTQTGQILGTPQYMAPEQAAGSRQLGPAVDVYALGAILFECLAGKPPFGPGDPISVLLQVKSNPAPDLRSIRPDAPRDLAAVVRKCLEKDPARRYPSAEALADDLGRFLARRPTRARPVTQGERVWFWARRNPAVAGLLGLLAGVLCAAFVAVSVLWVEAEDKARAEAYQRSLADAARTSAQREAARATAAEKDALDAAGLAKSALLEARRQEAKLAFARAVAAYDERRLGEGLDLLVRVSELSEQTGQTDLARAARTNLAEWPRHLPPATSRAFTPADVPIRRRPDSDPLEGAKAPVALAHQPDGAGVFVAGPGGDLRLWESDGVVRAYFPNADLPDSVLKRFAARELRAVNYKALAVSPNGRTLAAGTNSGELWVWATDQPEAVGWALATNNETVWAAAFSSDTALWTNDSHNGLVRWDLTNPARPVATAARSNPVIQQPVQAIVADPKSKRVYSGDRGGVIREWDAENRRLLREWALNGWVNDLAVSHDGRWLGVSSAAGTWLISLWAGSKPVPLDGAPGAGIAFAPNAPVVVTTDADKNVRFWHRDTATPLGVPLRVESAVRRPQFRPGADEFAVLVGGEVHTGRLPAQVCRVLLSNGRPVRALEFSPTGDRFAVGEDRGKLSLFDRDLRLVSQGGMLWSGEVRFDPDPVQPFLYVGGRDGVQVLGVSGPGLTVRRASLPGAPAFFAADWASRWMDEPFGHAARSASLKAAETDLRAGLPREVETQFLTLHPRRHELLAGFADRLRLFDLPARRVVSEWTFPGGVLEEGE
ncbi:MAG: hypothetical protein K2V38_27660, partial [Gemmataceae bacterium]|nr:hypothetical protein [Gemmataceae bacterium]